MVENFFERFLLNFSDLSLGWSFKRISTDIYVIIWDMWIYKCRCLNWKTKMIRPKQIFQIQKRLSLSLHAKDKMIHRKGNLSNPMPECQFWLSEFGGKSHASDGQQTQIWNNSDMMKCSATQAMVESNSTFYAFMIKI